MNIETDFRWHALPPVTRPYAEVIGDPISHSKSPLIHNYWLSKLGIDAEYRAAHVRAAELADYFAARRADPLWRGCNVTIPHKLAVLPFIDNVGELGTAIGAINTVFPSSHSPGLIGQNTDTVGFAMPLYELVFHKKLSLKGQTVVIIGSGGATNAILWALSQLMTYEIGEFVLIARNENKARDLLARHALPGRVLPIDAPIPPAKLLVNSSSLGMVGQPPLVIDLAPLPNDAIVYDIVYTPLETALLAAARTRDLNIIDGLQMLIGQAAAAFNRFFGKPLPRPIDSEELCALLTA